MKLLALCSFFCFAVVVKTPNPIFNEFTSQIFSQEIPQNYTIVDTFEIYLVLEEQFNEPKFRNSISNVRIKMAPIPKNQTSIILSKHANLSDIPFQDEPFTYFPVHPHNRDLRVPGTSTQNHPMRKNLLGRNLASRSKVLFLPNKKIVGVKMGTDHLSQGLPTNNKTSLAKEGNHGLVISEFIKERSEKINLPSQCEFLYETSYVHLKKNQEGHLYRNLDPLLDGDFFIPLFSFPYILPQLSAFTNKSHLNWGQDVFALIGECKARLLKDFGLQMETPNAQNFIIRLDQNLRLKSIIIKDLSDVLYVPIVHHNISFANYHDDNTEDFPRPYFHNSLWKFEKVILDFSLLRQWNYSQIESYLEIFDQSFNLPSITNEECLYQIRQKATYSERFSKMVGKAPFKDNRFKKEFPIIFSLEKFFRNPQSISIYREYLKELEK